MVNIDHLDINDDLVVIYPKQEQIISIVVDVYKIISIVMVKKILK
jgi:hypothetical protein